MIIIVPLTLFSFKFGLSASAVAYSGKGANSKTTDKPTELGIPWKKLEKNTDIFSLLQWRARITEHKGRDIELKELNEWVNNNSEISIKFITGDGGVGKTRLAAEFADSLQVENWAAGIVDLSQKKSFILNKKGSLLIIDYPEINKESVKALFDDLSKLSEHPKLRILF